MSDEAVIIRLDREQPAYQPGETLTGSFRINLDPTHDLRSIEWSILWYTEGKGDEDLGVHFFEKVTASVDMQIDLREIRRFSTRLPLSPFSYDGIIVKIRWCVRVRLVETDRKEIVADAPFQLDCDRWV